jgi:phospholipid-binding lipoprotein MlaA
MFTGMMGGSVLAQTSLPLPMMSDQFSAASDAEKRPMRSSEVGEDFLDDDLDELDEDIEIADPLEYWNRAMFHFNDKLYFWVFKPVATGYKAVVPTPIRGNFQNFFNNLGGPIRFVNCFLQGKMASGGKEICRFVINSTAGIGGLWDLASRHEELKQVADEDLGQTLGYYRMGNGFYLVWPFLGSSTLRDSIGMAGDMFLDPITYVNPTEAALGLRTFDAVNQTSFRIGDYEAFKEAAIEPYEAFRDAYIQHRASKVKK